MRKIVHEIVWEPTLNKFVHCVYVPEKFKWNREDDFGVFISFSDAWKWINRILRHRPTL